MMNRAIKLLMVAAAVMAAISISAQTQKPPAKRGAGICQGANAENVL